MSIRISGNLLEDSGEFYYFNSPGNFPEDSGECSKRFRGMFEDSGECSKRFRECSKKFQGMF